MNFYEALNVSTNATQKDIKKAYRTLAKKYHPDTYVGDKEFAEEKMQEINVAYDTLSNLDSKKAYDEKLGINVIKNNNYSNKASTYSRSDYGPNNYNKEGVNYDVKYTPNNNNIKYDSRGYAESNYHTYEKVQSYEKTDFSIKNIKRVFAGKNLKYTLSIGILVILVIAILVLQVIKSMNDFFDSTHKVYDKINSAKIEAEQTRQNIDFEEDIFPLIKSTVNDVKTEGKELLNKYDKYWNDKQINDKNN